MKTISALGGVAVSLALLGATVAFTQEKQAPKEGAENPKTAAKKGDDKLKGRVPPNYAKIDLTTAQREKIYAIQAGYDAKLDELKDQIKALVEKRDSEIEAVLTPEQKAKLDQARAESKKKTEDKAEAKKKAAEEKKGGEKTGDKTEPSKKPAESKEGEGK